MRLLCGKDAREVEVHESRGTFEVTVDGARFAFSLERVAPGTFVLRNGERLETFHCVRDGGEIHMFWRGVAYRLTDEKERARAAQRATSAGLEAPMPGKVIKVNVAPGQAVAKGAEILVVEAMKMENAVRAPRDGTVKSVAVKVGDVVSPGVVLVELS